MKCEKHQQMIVLHAFSEGECKKCGSKVTTAHIPCDIVCDECSNKYSLCKVCGEEIEINN